MGQNTEKQTRYALLKGHNSELAEMPELKHSHHILRWLDEVGYYTFGANGILPITHTEIMAWQSNVCEKIEPEEALLLRELSSEFVNQFNKSKDRNEPAPVVKEIKDKAVLSAQIKEMRRRHNKKPSK